MGTSPLYIILPEATPSLLQGAAINVATVLGYSAMAGVIGGGGLGAIALQYQYGYYRYQKDVLWSTVALLVIMVMIIQEVGGLLAKKKIIKRDFEKESSKKLRKVPKYLGYENGLVKRMQIMKKKDAYPCGKIRSIFKSLRLKTTLTEIDIDDKDFEIMAKRATRNGNVGHYELLDADSIQEILKLAL